MPYNYNKDTSKMTPEELKKHKEKVLAKKIKMWDKEVSEMMRRINDVKKGKIYDYKAISKNNRELDKKLLAEKQKATLIIGI